MNKGDEIREGIRRKGLGMQDAADKLGISRTTLHTKLAGADNDKEFVQLVQERLGIDTNNPARGSLTSVNERQVGDVILKYHTIPLKKKRTAEMWLPNDLDKADVKTIEQWLELMESTL